MTLTIELTPETEARLKVEAQRRGLDAVECARRLIEDGPGQRPQTGAEIAAFWEREGVVPLYLDRPDSPELARELRRQAESRGPLV